MIRKIIYAPLVALGLCAYAAAEPALAQKPNILFIFADDLSYDALAYAGNAQVKTPNIDRLAASGTSFSCAYNSGAWHGAVCVASRTMLNTGRQVWHSKNLKLKDELKQQHFWAQQLAAGGYRTAMTGKWHVDGADVTKSFEITREVTGGMLAANDKSVYQRPSLKDEDVWDPADPSKGGYWRKDGRHWSAVTADEGIAQLQEAETDKRPSFLYLAFNAPHDPRQAPREYLDMYPPADITLPKPFLPEYPYAREIGCTASLRDENLAPFPRTEHAVQVHRAEYYALISHLDAQVGRVLDALAKSNRAKDTLVIFTADHGLACGHHGLLGKQNMYEHSLRVPLLISGPGFAAGAKIDTPCYMQDIMPTTLAAAGLEIPEWIEFKPLQPLLGDARTPHYSAIYGGYMTLQRMIRKDEMKLIHYPQANAYRLYDLARDPDEARDLAADPAHAGQLADLKVAMESLQQSFEDPLTAHPSDGGSKAGNKAGDRGL